MIDKADKSLKIVVKGAIIFLIGMFFSKLFNYFFRLLTARLGPESYGMITLATSFVAVLAVLSTLGLNNGILRYVPYYYSREENSKVRGVINFSLKTSIITGIIVGIILFALSGFIPETFFPHFDKTTLSAILKITAFIIPVTAILFIFFASFEAFRFLKYELYTKNIFEGAFKLAFTFLMISLGYSVIGVMFVYLAAVVGSMILSFYYIRKYIHPIIKKETKPEIVGKELMQYSLPLLLSGLCMILLLSVDTWIIGYSRTAAEVGLYNAAYPTAQLLYTIPSIILILFLPVLADLYSKEDKESFKTLYKSTTKWIFLINLPIIILFFIFSKEILSVLFGSQYVSASLSLLILSIGFFGNSLVMTSERVLMVVKKTKFILGSYLTVLIVNTVLNLYLVPAYGIKGASIASAISYLALTLFFILGSYYYSKTLPFTLQYLKAVVAALVPSGLVFLITFTLSYSIYTFVAAIIVFLLSYLLFLVLLKAFDKDDIMIIKSIKNKISSTILSKTNISS